VGSTAKKEAVAAGQPVEVTSKSADSGRAGSVSRTDEKGRKWIGDIPHDVWFDDPLAVAGKGTELIGNGSPTSRSTAQESSADVAGMSRSTVGAGKPPESTNVAADSPRGSNGADWKDLVSAGVLDGEVKSIRNNLSTALQSVGRYNGKYKEVQSMGSTLAALAEIAAEHPDAVRWKRNAPSIRDLVTSLEKAAQEAGVKPYESARKSFESLAGLLDGNSSAGEEATAARIEFSQCADRGGVMKRIDQSFQWLKKEVGSEKALKDKAEKTGHEASLMAALARVIAAPDYPSADEPGYAAHAQALIKGAREMSRAVQSEDFAGFSAARDNVQKKCNECHSDYRF
jgi:hypothetical protein